MHIMSICTHDGLIKYKILQSFIIKNKFVERKKNSFCFRSDYDIIECAVTS